MPRIPLGPWRPDTPELSGAIRDARGVIPTQRGYQPIFGPVVQSDALPLRARQGFSMRDLGGNVHTFVGTEKRLYELDGTSWVDRSKGGADYTSSETANWCWTTFGDRVCATNGEENIQYFDASGAAPRFADLPNAPRAKIITAWRDFLVVGDTEDASFEVAWSGFNNSEQWTYGTNQSDKQPFADGGRVKGFLPTDQLFVIQEYGIRRGVYVGSPVVIAFDRIELAQGAIEPTSVVARGSRAFYLSEDGFYELGSGGSRPIGVEKIDQWFKADFNRAYAYRMSGAPDPVNKVVYWSYTSNNSPSGQPDTILAHSWVTGEWAYARLNVSCLVPGLTSGLTLEDLDAFYPALEDMLVSLDDPTLTGGALRFAAYNALNQLVYFAGDAIEATIETGDAQLIPGRRAKVIEGRVIGDAATASLSLGVKEAMSDDVTWKSPQTQRASGRIPLKGAGRYARAKLVVPASTNWTYASDVEMEAVDAGSR